MTKISKHLSVIVRRADNQLLIYLNGREVYNRKTEGDPSLSENVELTSQLKKGRNSLLLIGVDWGERVHFEGEVRLDDDVVPFNHLAEHSPPNAGKVWDLSYELEY